MDLSGVLELLARSSTAVTTVQGIVIALFAAFAMRRYTQILFFSFLAIVVDQFIVIIFDAFGGDDVDELRETAWSVAGTLEFDVIVVRFLGYLVVISALFFAKNVLFNKG